MVELNNTPMNYTSFGNYSVWLNTVTEGYFWTYIGVIIPYVALFFIFRKFGVIRSFVTTSYIMFVATWMLSFIFKNAAGQGIVSPLVTTFSFGLFLVATAVVLFVNE